MTDKFDKETAIRFHFFFFLFGRKKRRLYYNPNRANAISLHSHRLADKDDGPKEYSWIRSLLEVRASYSLNIIFFPPTKLFTYFLYIHININFEV